MPEENIGMPEKWIGARSMPTMLSIPLVVPPGLPEPEPTQPNAITAMFDSVFNAFAGPIGTALSQVCTFVEQQYIEAGEPLGKGMALLWFLSLVGERMKEEQAK